MGIKIFTDSTSDIPGELVKKYGIERLPLTVNFGGEEYRDGVDITSEEFLVKLRQSAEVPSTSQITPSAFVSAYRDELNKGNGIISIHIASELSGTYQSAVTAKTMLGSENITVIDSKTCSVALGMAVLKAARLASDGLGRAEIAEKVEEYKKNLRMFVAVDTLVYLKKGGRVSSLRAALGSIFNIKPILMMAGGKVDVLEKVRGEGRIYKKLMEIIKKTGRLREGSTIGIANVLCPEKVEIFKRMILDEIGKVNFIEAAAGSVLATHVGPGAFSLALD